jgi:peptide methionine sulfoxide reductase msrA/msrB
MRNGGDSMKKLIVMWMMVGSMSMELIGQKDLPQEKATFAGGCFWCMQPPFEKIPGVMSVVAGYAGGQGDHPTYATYAQQGYVEAVLVTYDPKRVRYEDLLTIFWHNINPTDAGGQFNDRGPQYRSAIFYHTEHQKEEALHSKQTLQQSGRFTQPIVTEIIKATTFYPAEEYHQDYHIKHPYKYAFYRYRSGRDSFITKTWGNEANQLTAGSPFIKPSDAQLRAILTPLQYEVTQRGATERAFDNEYWNNKRPGIYVDIVSGEPLFSSRDLFDSGTGWPSFTKPLEPATIVEREVKGWFTTSTEVRSKLADSHLGHVFKDGPPPTGLRYCMNSAALRFIPAQDLEKEGLGRYTYLFAK